MDLLEPHDDGGLGPGWPHRSLDVDALLRSGWRPVPFRQFVLKVHSRCNLACDYCYVYRSADQSWRHRPVRMSRTTLEQTAARIAEHVRGHTLPRVGVVLHGGEPLLAGTEFLARAASTLRAAVPAGVEMDISAQTNATLIDEAMLQVLDEHRIRLGVSLDGDAAAHDARRARRGGQGSHPDVVRGLELLRRRRHLFGGILCVVNPWADPVAAYEHLVGFEPPVLDFLLPHANWSDPPRRPSGGSATAFGDWLVAVFDRWYTAIEPETTVRLFDEVIRGLCGRPIGVDSIGLSPAQTIVVETDGTIEQVDSLKTAYDGAARTGLDVRGDSFDAALLQPPVAARQIGVGALADVCRRCAIHSVCGGGYYPHRYHRSTGFRNPSVYCDDLARLIRHIQRQVRGELGDLSCRLLRSGE